VERPSPRVEFVRHDVYDSIVTHPWNKDSAGYYTLLPDEEDSIDCLKRKSETSRHCDDPENDLEQKRIVDNDVASWIKLCSQAPNIAACNCPGGGPCDYERDGDVSSRASLDRNERLSLLRRYLLIVVENGPIAPESAYVSYWDGKRWYYIDKGDEISQKNFDLLTLFLTMMATPSPATPPVQTINVGG
jgi:hypothetical protein